MAGKFFHTPKPNKFSIPPRYYDPGKEEREDREKRMKAELGIKDVPDPDKPYVPNIRGQFRRPGASNVRSADADRQKSNRRLIWMIVILVLVIYLFFYSNLFH